MADNNIPGGPDGTTLGVLLGLGVELPVGVGGALKPGGGETCDNGERECK